MPKEIERKFLVDLSDVVLPDNGEHIEQGYLPSAKNINTIVRVRVKGAKAYLTIKGENKGAVRTEFEYAIPIDEALEMLKELCQKPFIEKTRYELPVGGHLWELDIFRGENAGLVVAEIELTEENETFDLPSWVREEVTSDSRYYNSNLLHHPYRELKAE